MLKDLSTHGLPIPAARMHIKIERANQRLTWVYQRMLQMQGRPFVWQPEYALVADWLADNHGRGLLLRGAAGRGKTFLARYVLPTLLLHVERKVAAYYDATALGRYLEEAKRKPIVIVDDIGTESVYKHYGNEIEPFAELVDAAEKSGTLLIVTTNLTLEQLNERYKGRTDDRLASMMSVVDFEGGSLRP